MHYPYNFADAQKFLIKPFERLRFVIIFILTTTYSHVIAALIISQPAFDSLWERSLIQYRVATGIIDGTLIGAVQWLILRKYVSDWKWILVNSVTFTFTSVLNPIQIEPIAEYIEREKIFFPHETSLFYKTFVYLFTNELSIPGIILLIFAIFAFFIGLILMTGWLQWYIIRPYVIKTRWWIFIPLIAWMAMSFIFALQFLPYYLRFSPNVWLHFNSGIIRLTIYPTTQAIGFCLLKKKSVSEQTILQSPLALAPDLVNYWDIQRLKNILYIRISRIWKTNLIKSMGKLKYFVGINSSGSMIIYESMNQASSDNVNQTSLPELASVSSGAALETESLRSLAKFQVVFIPPGTLQIDSWRGIPLLWIGMTVYAAIIGISILSAWLKFDFLFFRAYE